VKRQGDSAEVWLLNLAAESVRPFLLGISYLFSDLSGLESRVSVDTTGLHAGLTISELQGQCSSMGMENRYLPALPALPARLHVSYSIS
jgi:hypothetical protein